LSINNFNSGENMKKILGLDLGVTSIGWAIISEDENEKRNEILGMGSRIIPLSKDDNDEFSKGQAITKNRNRTQKRTQRKGYDRYQLRRRYLIEELKENEMLPGIDLYNLPKLKLWGLRSDAASKKIGLRELGRVLLHLNQKRGYKSARSEANADKKDTDYVAGVKSRYEELRSINKTIGEYFYEKLLTGENDNEYFRVKTKVYPREAYIEEFDKIMLIQKSFYPEILTESFIDRLRNEIIYYQRKLKSQKGLVAVCEFEGFNVKNKEGRDVFTGPKVAPKSSPIFQVCKIWENINNIRLFNKWGEELIISIEKKREIFNYLNENEKITVPVLASILGYKKDDLYFNKQMEKGLPGNLTYTKIAECFESKNEYKHLFEMEIKVIETDEDVYLPDRKTAEIIREKKKKIISPDIEKTAFYGLWHTIYSIADKEELKNALIKKYNLPEGIAGKLSELDFVKQGFGNKSHKCMRKLLPYLMEGDSYYEASSYAGYNHSNSITKNENLRREVADKLELLGKNSLRQPIVEKILNQMIHVVNAIIEKYGKPDEIRVELARELKQSREEREDTFKFINKREKENDLIRKELNEQGLRETRNNVIKYRLYKEIDNDEKKLNAMCLYCGQPITFTAAMNGAEVDVDHIIPQSLLFDDSQSNKILVHRKCNATKSNLTAYDFMKNKSIEEFESYIDRVNNLRNRQIINKKKATYLLMPAAKIPKDFIERQLRETQYIAKKAIEILGLCAEMFGQPAERLLQNYAIYGVGKMFL